MERSNRIGERWKGFTDGQRGRHMHISELLEIVLNVPLHYNIEKRLIKYFIAHSESFCHMAASRPMVLSLLESATCPDAYSSLSRCFKTIFDCIIWSKEEEGGIQELIMGRDLGW